MFAGVADLGFYMNVSVAAGKSYIFGESQFTSARKLLPTINSVNSYLRIIIYGANYVWLLKLQVCIIRPTI
jgi:hypothetical protein